MKHLFAAAVALSMLAAPAVMAAPYDQRPANQPRANQGQNNQNQGRDYHKPTHQNSGPQNYGQSKPSHKPQYSYNGRKYDAVRGPAWNAPKGYDARRDWRHGQKLPAAYRSRGYYVDYRAYHLKQPPRGYSWVRANDRNVYLVNDRSGLIAQIVLNLFY